MKDFLIEIIKAISFGFLSIFAAILVIVIGGIMVGFGLHKEWEWLTNGGIFVVVFGFVFLTRFWWQSD